MAISAFTWSLKSSLDPASDNESLKKLITALSVKEMFMTVISSSCTLFVYSENSNPNKDTVYDNLNLYFKNAILERSDIKEMKEQEAVFYFLQSANGLIGENRLEHVQSFSNDFNLAKKATLIGPVFQRLFQRSIWLHEKIRISTNYFRYPTEPSKIFSELTEKIYGSIAPLKVQINGFDNNTIQFISTLYQFGCRNFVFDGGNSDFEILSASFVYSNLITKGTGKFVDDANVLIYCSNETFFISEDQLSLRMAQKGNDPFLILNTNSSKQLQSTAQKIFNVYCYNTSDLQNIVEKNKQSQRNVLKEIDPWINQEVKDFYKWLSGNEKYKFGNIIGQSVKMQELFELISRISQTDISVLIQGESGTGKELVSRAIHKMSSRSDKPFVVVNCGAIPENLLESELFGHLRGSFTGAVSDKKGLFYEANNGTILLDEIAEMPQQLQVKLLRFLQEGDLKPVGSNETIKIDVRVLAATNKNLQEMVESGTFRSDLFYRLNVILLELPLLNNRREDIPLLADYFLKKYAQKLNKEVHELSEEALQKLYNYAWPGNVRELENAMEHAVALSLGKQITPDDFPGPVKNAKQFNLQSASSKISNNGFTKLKDVEKTHIAKILNDMSWDYEKACQVLGIGRTTLWRKIKEYDIKQ